MEAINPLPHLNFTQQRNIPAKFSLLNVAESKPVETSHHASLEPSSLPNICSLSKINPINLVKSSHAQIIKQPDQKDSYIKVQSLITSYLKLGDFQSAAMVFFLGFSENYSCWNSFLEEFKSFGGDPFEILQVFAYLHNMGVDFGSESLAIVLKLCGNLMGSWLGLQLHVCLIKKGFDRDVYLNCALMNFYGKCWGLDIASKAFDEMSHLSSDHSSLLWNEAVLVNLRNGKWSEGLEIFRKMQFLSLNGNKNSFTIAKILQACGKAEALDEGKQIHGYIIRHGMESNTLICNSLINMYTKNGNLELARKVFDSMENRNISTWNSIISGYVGFGFLEDSWKLLLDMRASNMEPDIVTWNSLLSGNLNRRSYQEVLIILQHMQNTGVAPNARSITTVLQAISELSYLKLGQSIHSYVVRNGLDSDLHLGTSLLDMYVKNNDLNSAQAVFDAMKERNIFAWNAMISGYSFKGNFVKSLSLLNQMKREGTKPDLVTYNSMISGYSMSGRVDEALAMIQQIKNSSTLTPNVISWTSLISGCSQSGDYENALEFFCKMQNEGVKPNAATIASLLRACAGLSLLRKGKEAHCFSIKNSYTEDRFVCTAIIDMYSKCGDIKSAYNFFWKVEAKTLASSNSMIMGFSTNGYGKQALSLFHKMHEMGFDPDAITMTAVLTGCKNSGLLDQGWGFFDSMETKYGIIPTIQHYSCMVDLLGKSGYIDEAWDFIKNMPVDPDSTVWGAFLGSCRIHDSNIQLAEIAARKLFKLEPNNPANYVLLMNIYASAERWDDVEKVKDLMGRRGMKLGTVWSWIEIEKKVHVFSPDGNSHMDGEIYFELYRIISEIKKMGYVVDTKCVYQNVDEEEKEKLLLCHTEKKAITYGLIKMKRDNMVIRVIKNTRICADCHSFAKYVSLVSKREIVVKDGVRFHHFRDGVCSCRDFW